MLLKHTDHRLDKYIFFILPTQKKDIQYKRMKQNYRKLINNKKHLAYLVVIRDICT